MKLLVVSGTGCNWVNMATLYCTSRTVNFHLLWVSLQVVPGSTILSKLSHQYFFGFFLDLRILFIVFCQANLM